MENTEFYKRYRCQSIKVTERIQTSSVCLACLRQTHDQPSQAALLDQFLVDVQNHQTIEALLVHCNTKVVFTHLSAEKDRSEVVFVASSANSSFTKLHTPENAVLSVTESSNNHCTTLCIEKFSANSSHTSLQRGSRRWSCASSSFLHRSSL